MVARLISTAGIGAFLGLVAGANATALLSVLYGKPIAGGAVITLYLLPAAFGALAGACKDY
jgi:hypothetical protein